MADPPSLERLTRETFEPHRGQTFRLMDEELGELELELAAVETNGLQGRADRQQFSLRFEGPPQPVLAQRIYRLENDHLPPLEIFLVPVAGDAEGVSYEAVFT